MCTCFRSHLTTTGFFVFLCNLLLGNEFQFMDLQFWIDFKFTSIKKNAVYLFIYFYLWMLNISLKKHCEKISIRSSYKAKDIFLGKKLKRGILLRLRSYTTLSEKKIDPPRLRQIIQSYLPICLCGQQVNGVKLNFIGCWICVPCSDWFIIVWWRTCSF